MALKQGSGRTTMQDRLEELKKQLDDDFRKPRHRTRNEIEREIETFFQRSERVARKTRSRLHRHIDYELNGKTGQRRRQALADFLLDRQDEFAEQHPNLDLVAEFIRMDGAPFGTFANLDHRKAFLVGAAIWMIDELQRKHKLQEAGLCLTHDAEEFMEVDIPDIHVPRIPDELLRSMIYAIWHRNDGTGKKRSGKETDQWDILTEEAALRREPVEYRLPEKNGEEDLQKLKELYDPLDMRQRFDAIIALMSRTRIDRAVERYKALMQDFTERYIHCSEKWYEKTRTSADSLKKRIEQFDHNQKNTAQNRNILTGPLAKPPAVVQWPVNLPGPNLLEDNMDNQIRWISSGLEKHSDLLTERDQFIINAQMVFDGLWDKTKGELVGDDCAEILNGLEIKNPYEICFAFLYLLDSGSDLPWIHCISYAVMSKACTVLPWGQMYDAYCDIWYPDDEYEDEITDEADDEEPEEEPLSQEEERKKYENYLENPPDRIEREAEIYKQRYQRFDSHWREEHLGKEPEYCNLPQTVFESSRVVLPRDSMFDGMDEIDFTENGYSEGEAKIMLHLTSLASEAKRRPYSWSDLLYDSYEEEEKDDEEEGTQEPAEDIEALKKQNRTYKAEIDRLRAQIHELASEKREIEAEAQKDRETSNLEHQELVDLRELIFILEHGEQEPEKQNAEISYPYETETRMIVFGGHETWLKAIRPMLPGIRFVDKDMIPKTDTIRNAEMVWIQPNAISHAYYYKIMDVARQHKIPVRYFTNASAEKCAEQLALADMKLSGVEQ